MRRRWFALLCVVTVVYVAVYIAYIPSGSMEPSIHAHSVHVCWRLPYAVSNPESKRGEIVVFKDDEELMDLTYTQNGDYLFPDAVFCFIRSFSGIRLSF